MEETKKKRKKDASLLELIPTKWLSSKQKALRPAKQKHMLPIYKLLREPTHLDEFDWDIFRNIAIWRDNETLICVCDYKFSDYRKRKGCFTLDCGEKYELKCTIYGKTDATIAETFTFFCSLKNSEESCLNTGYFQNDDRQQFCLSALQPEQLARILDANPTRQFHLSSGTWNKKQSVILASRSFPMNLKLTGVENEGKVFAFEDKGTAFVDALEKRKSSFGSFFGGNLAPFSRDNQKRLLQLEIFDKLNLCYLDEESKFLPFATKVNALDYTIAAEDVDPEAFRSLGVATKDLSLTIYLDPFHGWDDWDTLMIPILNRVAILGHFERLCISAECAGSYDYESFQDSVARVVDALIDAVINNPKLVHLDLSQSHYQVEWDLHFQKIFKAMEGHPGLRTVIVNNYPSGYDSDDYDSDDSESKADPDYSLLEQLLSGNRSITVLDAVGNKISNGTSIDEIYAMNYFFNGSAKLVKENTELRPLLVASALVESTKKTYKHTALLLSNHTDVLCEFVDCVDLDDFGASQQLVIEASVLPDAHHQTNDRSKRKTRVQPTRAVKKVARR